MLPWTLSKLEIRGTKCGNSTLAFLTCCDIPLVENMEEPALCCSECGATYAVGDAIEYVKAFGLSVGSLLLSLVSSN